MTRFFDAIRSTGFRRGPSRIVGGICAGMAEQWNLDITIVRIVVVLLLLLPVLGVWAYLVAWLLLPWQDGSIPLERIFSGSAGTA
ncbi:phage shock protein C, PspC [Beutenbergia cavernae DSM 12333]|uniref:Phage shock protein C, PspC n=1 Tax=Beutenbergia cavernae (strain ATCC BAA-8 / DSM 12333 / CCUG 43141 / JCM 11478 / NBRC 16432 / NCIMB 13614 / HKI 0122) TaxID=471853 RepID=C5BW44_BEUC1|nr:PspC domain-containing protein [Beutenbergia cavernae]ACQ80645.1 phage shock protein C, PspC [Beutenbergia cavernae DSM 12333]